MTDQTPDPWQRVERQEMPGSGDQWMRAWQVDRALAAERAQHQQEIAELRRQNCDWAADAQHWRTQAGDQLGTEATRQMAEVLLAQRDETIRRQAEQIRILRSWRYLDELEARCATLTAALEQIASWSEGYTVGPHFDEPASAQIARAALSGVPTP